MKKTIFFSTVAFVIGALIQDKYNVIDKAKDLYGKTKDTVNKKYSEYKEKVKENIEELKEEASETVNDEKPIEENDEKKS
jgi:gas vesicle protein